MQRAARKVAHENARLRSLLARHGVLQEEVDDFLKSFDDTEAPRDTSVNATSSTAPYQSEMAIVGSSPVVDTTRSNDLQRARRNLNNTTGPDDSQSSEESRMNFTTTLQYSGPSEPSLERPMQSTPSVSQQSQTNHREAQNNFAPQEIECATTSECFCPPTSAPKIRPTTNGLEISCETAATIIVEMRGDGDVDSIRASLGCTSREECIVRNSTVLQIMDEG
jgi:hypothetical protein